jgi:membrane-associated phospholipid phosphatase
MTRSCWHYPWFMIPVLLFFILGLSLNLVLPVGDELLFLNRWRAEPYNSFFRLSTLLGEYHVYVLAGLPALLWRLRYGLLVALTGLLISPISYVVKDRIGKDRPITWLRTESRHDEVLVVPGEVLNEGRTSFPSGHSMAAFGLYSALAVLLCGVYPRLGLALALCAVLTALSRIFLVQHFLADVLGGALLGLLVGELARRILTLPAVWNWKALDGGLRKKRNLEY